jgi:hypothetical protein
LPQPQSLDIEVGTDQCGSRGPCIRKSAGSVTPVFYFSKSANKTKGTFICIFLLGFLLRVSHKNTTLFDVLEDVVLVLVLVVKRK